MNFRISLLLILITGFVLSCSTGPEFERDNMNDPENGQFTPDVGNLTLSIDSSKNVTLIWNDISDFEDGFIIQKSYENKESFFDLDTLPANSSRYIDSTKKLAVDTFYRVRSFSESSDSLGSTEVNRLDLNPLESISVPDVTGNQVSITWKTNSTGYADSFLIEKMSDNGNWVLLDTVKTSVSSYSYVETDSIYYLKIRIIALLDDPVNSNNEIGALKKDIAINFPTELQIKPIFEDSVLITWKDNSTFETEFIFKHSVNGLEKVHNLNSNSEYFQTKINPSKNSHTFSIFAKNNEKTSKILSTSKIIVSDKPSGFDFKQGNNSQLEFSWFQQDVLTSSIIVERAVNLSNNFIEISTINNDTKNFVDTNIDIGTTYTYKIRSLTSDYSNSITVRNTTVPKLQNKLDLEDNVRFIISSKIDPYIYFSRNSNLIKFDTNSETSDVIFTSPEIITKVVLSPNEKYFAVSGISDNIYIYENIDGFPLLSTLTNTSVWVDNFTFSNDNEEIILIEYYDKPGGFDGDSSFIKNYDFMNGMLDTRIYVEDVCLEGIFNHNEADKYILDCSDSMKIFNYQSEAIEQIYSGNTGNSDGYLDGNKFYFSGGSDGIIEIDLVTNLSNSIYPYYDFLTGYVSTRNHFILSLNTLRFFTGLENFVAPINQSNIGNIAVYNSNSDILAIKTENNLFLYNYNTDWTKIQPIK